MYSFLCKYVHKCAKFAYINSRYKGRGVLSTYFVHTRFKHTENPWSGDNSGAGEVQIAIGDGYVALRRCHGSSPAG